MSDYYAGYWVGGGILLFVKLAICFCCFARRAKRLEEDREVGANGRRITVVRRRRVILVQQGHPASSTENPAGLPPGTTMAPFGPTMAPIGPTMAPIGPTMVPNGPPGYYPAEGAPPSYTPAANGDPGYAPYAAEQTEHAPPPSYDDVSNLIKNECPPGQGV